MWDSREQIRVAAAKALAACLSVLRPRTYHLEWYCFIYRNTLEGLQHGTAESAHGSLLVVAETLTYTGDFMLPRFKGNRVCVIYFSFYSSFQILVEISRAIMHLKDHKSRIVRAAIVQLIPVMTSTM